MRIKAVVKYDTHTETIEGEMDHSDEINPPYRDVQVMQVIVTNILRRGEGTEQSRLRIIRQVWTMDGQLIAENDPCGRSE